MARELGVGVRMPLFWIDSRAAHSVALALSSGRNEAVWRERVWTAVFEEGRDIGVATEIERLADDVGVEGAIAASDDFFQLHEATEAAREAEVTGVPTFHIGFPLGGIQEPATMRMLFQRWVAKRQQLDPPT